MKIRILQALAIFVLLISCTSTDLGTSTEKASSRQDTPTSLPLSASSYPPCAPIYQSHFAEPKPDLQLKLTNGLTLEEYQSFHSVHEQERGCLYAFRDRVHVTEIILENSIQISIKSVNEKIELVTVKKNGSKVFETKISTYIYSGLLEAWGYDAHWVIEVMTTNGPDIIRDGISLKEVNAYEQVFAFQLLNNKPLFFFQRQDGTFGINYDSAEMELAYDNIPYTNPSPGLDPSIMHYQNMVVFSAVKEGVAHVIALGAFSK